MKTKTKKFLDNRVDILSSEIKHNINSAKIVMDKIFKNLSKDEINDAQLIFIKEYTVREARSHIETIMHDLNVIDNIIDECVDNRK